MALIFKPQTKRIEFDNGEWIEVKSTLTYGDIKHLTAQEAEEIDEGEKGAEVGLIRVGFVMAWNLTDESGEVAPITAANLEALEAWQFSRLMVEFTAARRPLSAS